MCDFKSLLEGSVILQFSGDKFCPFCVLTSHGGSFLSAGLSFLTLNSLEVITGGS